MMRRWATLLGVGWLLSTALVRADNWPQFRGPNGSAVSRESQLPAEWTADKHVAWKVKLPGYGWSSPIVWDDKIFLTTAVTEHQKKPTGGFGGGFGPPGGPGGPGGPRGGRPFGPPGAGKGDRPYGPPGGGRGDRPFGPPGGGMPNFGTGGKPPDAVYHWYVYCLDRNTGAILWKQQAAEHKPTIPTHPSNTYASETPVTDGERVYAYFGMTGLYCYDLGGKLLWSKELGSYPMMAGWGTGSSPVIDEERVFVQCDNEKQSFLVAFDKKTGKEIWRVDRPVKSTWGTPYLWRTRERTELVACGSPKAISYDPAAGKVLWELSDVMGGCNATPAADENMLYLGAGGPFGTAPLFAIRAGASGDLTLKKGQTSSAGIAWSRTQAGPSMASPLLYEGYLYILEHNGGMISCYDAKTGEPAYRKQRLPQAKGFTSSPWAHDGKIFCLDDSGQTFIVKAGPKYELLGKNEIKEMFWSSPALAGGAIYLRGVENLYCIRQ